MPGFPRHTQSLGASRRKAGSRYPRAASARSRHHRGRDLEDLQAALAQLKLARCPHSLIASLAALP
jgi:hypothetical protein